MARHTDRGLAAADDYVIDQGWGSYTADQHAMWRALFARQSSLLVGRACATFLDGLETLELVADGIPDFARLSQLLSQRTGWRVVSVPGLVPDEVFFHHLANRRFPATNWIRQPAQIGYLQEPDVFHDVFGHVPMLADPVFADYLEAFGQGGLKARRLGALPYLARLYWYTVEFGLIRAPDGLRIYGSGIASSGGESVYCLDSPKPRRVAFDMLRIMQTRYRIDDFQETYFVIDGFDQLFSATRPDFAPYYRALAGQADYAPGEAVPGDRLVAIASPPAP